MPKTGSRTLRDVVYTQFYPDRIFSGSYAISNGLDNWKDYPPRKRWNFARNELRKRLESESLPPLEAVTAHMPYGWHELLVDRPFKYITYLRHPVRRYISFYNHFKEGGGHPTDEAINRDSVSLDQFIDREDIYLSSFQENIQVKLLTGNFSPTSETLNRAIQNIDRNFLVVGTTETFDQDLLRISNKLGWTMPFYARRNRSNKHIEIEDISVNTLHKIACRNVLDISLYEYIRAKREGQKNMFFYLFKSLNRVRNSYIVSDIRRRLRSFMGYRSSLPTWLRPE